MVAASEIAGYKAASKQVRNSPLYFKTRLYLAEAVHTITLIRDIEL